MKTFNFIASLIFALSINTSFAADTLSTKAIEKRLATSDDVAIAKKGEEHKLTLAQNTNTSKDDNSEESSTNQSANQTANQSQQANTEEVANNIDVEKLYQKACLACHATGAANAPKLGVAADWETRIPKGRETLIENTINGIGAMPPRGGFNYSDEEIAALVDYMIAEAE